MDETGRELLRLLDGLPLALGQAASYIYETGVDITSYTRLYKQRWDDLMRSDTESGSPLIDYEQRSVGTTWIISLKAIEARSESAANLLRLWAFLDNRDLWHGLLQVAADSREHWPEWVREIACNEVEFLNATRLLLRYSLIDSQESVQGSYYMHPVVHRWASYIQGSPEKMKFLWLAVMIVGSLVPKTTEKAYWVLQQRLLAHAERCSWWMSEIYGANKSFNDIMAPGAVHAIGMLYRDQGRLAEAEHMYERALQGCEMALGADHASTLATVNNLGSLYARQGRLVEAEKMYQRALQGCEMALGADHTSTLDTVNNLGNLYTLQGKLAEAEKMYEQALQGCEKALGADHTSTLATVNNLGGFYKAQGRLAKAEQMYKRALQGCEKALGADHTSTLDTVNNLGNLYAAQGRLAEAEQMYERALEGYEKTIGTNNILTYIPALNTMWGLGSLSEHQSDIVKARIIYSKAFIGYEQVVGPRHPGSQRLQEILHALDTVAEIDGSENARKPGGTRLLQKKLDPSQNTANPLKSLALGREELISVIKPIYIILDRIHIGSRGTCASWTTLRRLLISALLKQSAVLYCS
jgi:tetratricopeptide (TPR) repeat protein